MNQTPLLRPKPLSPGDKVGLVCPASPPKNPSLIAECEQAVKTLGFEPVLGQYVYEKSAFLAGTDSQRMADLVSFFRDDEIKAILCIRGGYGCNRLLPSFPFDVVANHPKLIIGYSDLTSLLLAIQQRTGLTTIHGPMIAGDFVMSHHPETRRRFVRLLSGEWDPNSSIMDEKTAGTGIQVLHDGSAVGPLLGGNLALVCSLLGTPWQPDFRGSLLFLEDVNESPYRIDRMLTQLHQTGVLETVGGILFGHFTQDSRAPQQGWSAAILDVLRERTEDLKIPVMAQLPFGHATPNLPLPIGIQAKLSTQSKSVTLQEAVTDNPSHSN